MVVLKNRAKVVIFFLLLLIIPLALSAVGNVSDNGIGIVAVPEEVGSPTSAVVAEIIPNGTEVDNSIENNSEELNVPVETVVPSTEDTLVEVPEPSLIRTVLSLVADKITAFVGDMITLQATLTDDEENPLAEKKVDFYADDYIGSDVTDDGGKAEIQWETSGILPNPYSVTARYEGDDSSELASADVEVVVEELVEVVNSSVANASVAPSVTDVNTSEEAMMDINIGQNFSRLRPRLIEDNLGSYEIMQILKESGYNMKGVSFGLDKEGFYTIGAKFETAGDINLESQEILKVLHSNAYADYYWVEITDKANQKFIRSKVSENLLTDFVSDSISKAEFSNNLETKTTTLRDRPKKYVEINGQRVN